MKKIKVLIVGDHPHADEVGFLDTTEDGKINGINTGSLGFMALVHLENCPHNTEACYAASKCIRILSGENE